MKNLLITGASGNLGKTILQTFIGNPFYSVNVIVRKNSEFIAGCKTFYADLSNESETKAAIEEITNTQGPIDTAVLLAGSFLAGDSSNTSSTDVLKMLNGNLITAYNIAQPLISINRQHKRSLKLIFIGAKAALDSNLSINYLAYSLSKNTLAHYTNLINLGESNSGTKAYILHPNTIDTVSNREAMPEEDFSTWTKLTQIATAIRSIVEDQNQLTTIHF